MHALGLLTRSGECHGDRAQRHREQQQRALRAPLQAWTAGCRGERLEPMHASCAHVFSHPKYETCGQYIDPQTAL
jgi:hypothetical protein